jgi:hypothetical protein
LYKLEEKCGLPVRVAFAGLWCCADRDGRFKWRPEELKTDVLPHDSVDFEEVLFSLAANNFIVRYEANGEVYGYITGWREHQVINAKEAKSTIPPPDTVIPMNSSESTGIPVSSSEYIGIPFVERKGKEGKGREEEGNVASPDAEEPEFIQNQETQTGEENGMSVVNRLKRAAASRFNNPESDNHPIWSKVKAKYKYGPVETVVQQAFYDWAEDKPKSLPLPVSSFMGEEAAFVQKQEESEETKSLPDTIGGQKAFIHICKVSKGKVVPEDRQQKQLAAAAGIYGADVVNAAFDDYWSDPDLDEYRRGRAAKTFCDGVIGLCELQLDKLAERKRTEDAIAKTEIESQKIKASMAKQLEDRKQQEDEDAALAEEVADIMGLEG